ncbi:MAG: anthranilate synthase component I family protein [Bacteroidota bacterium]
MKIRLHTHYKKLLADTYTPVGIYLKLRDRFRNCILLESSDYHGSENSFSFICCEPIATFLVRDGLITESFPGGEERITPIDKNVRVADALQGFAERFEADGAGSKFIANGLFGYTSYDAARYFEDVNLEARKDTAREIPDMIYSVFRYVLAVDHFRDELHLVEYTLEGERHDPETILSLINHRSVSLYGFSVTGEERSSLSDQDYIGMVRQGKEECRKGNLFQIVLSREFSRAFKGDEFNVYRALRSVNPSPYLFYFDYGSFRIFGSSPEAQLVIKNGQAQIHPIAGTVKRTGNEENDAQEALALRNDKKETSEHVMLVDLARNDLSRNCSEVNVDVFAETQYYSHVIHLVSKVSGRMKKDNAVRVFADTFPAGTLSGAPKVKAMEVIDRCENDARGYYGGAIGYIGFNGDLNQAIIIRSFLSKGNTLYYRAGAGVVIASKEENELQEVNNKLGALKTAIALANSKEL